MREKRSGEKFAVKGFSKKDLKNEKFGEEGVKNEISVLRILDHPNTISFHELHETQNLIYVITELLEGGQVFELIDARVPGEKTKFVLRSVLQALSYLDEKGIIHRDLKPDNIIFKYPDTGDYSQNEVKLVDFGLSTFCDLDSYLFVRCGTPGFVAPEVINVNRNDKSIRFTPKCDVFAAGIIFFCMLTGVFPFDGDDFNEVFENNKRAIIDFKTKELESVDQIQIDLLKKMLKIEVEKRPSARECLQHPYFGDSTAKGSEESLLDDSESESCEGGIHSENIRKIENKYIMKPKKLTDINKNKTRARNGRKEDQHQESSGSKNIFKRTTIDSSK